ncbi:MAG: flagellar basal-body rod protein FlgF [Gammaproteobacteria bacterium]|nr:flagellar basal-body rod protein FlgF [Gammaproteobacteria bacterium]
MDRLLYISMSGASQNLRAQQTIAHNLANVSTTGFQADLDAYKSLAVKGSGSFDSRVYNQHYRAGIDFKSGSMLSTGRELDAAIQGEGLFAVQAPNGTEAYTRAGDFRVDPSGFLTTGTGLQVLGEGGPISIPPYQKLDIGSDGSISIIARGQTSEAVTVVDRIKMVKPPLSQLVKGNDGLLRLQGQDIAEADASIRLVSGTLEASNVNAVSELVSMLNNTRQFEIQVKMMKVAEETDESSTKLMRAK